MLTVIDAETVTTTLVTHNTDLIMIIYHIHFYFANKRQQSAFECFCK